MEINKIGPQTFLNMEEVYGYTMSDMGACWMWLSIISTLFRVFAYVALVRQEE